MSIMLDILSLTLIVSGGLGIVGRYLKRCEWDVPAPPLLLCTLQVAVGNLLQGTWFLSFILLAMALHDVWTAPSFPSRKQKGD